MNPERARLRNQTMSDKVITDPINRRHNPAQRGLDAASPVRWPVELLTDEERKRETKVVVYYFFLFSFAAQLATGSIPLAEQYRMATLVVAFVMWIRCFARFPLLFHACLGLSPFCLIPWYYTEFLAVRTVVCVVMPIYTAYFFRCHLIEFVASSPLPRDQAHAYIKHGRLPRGVISPPLISGSWKGFILGLQSWVTYLGNEQRLPTVYNSPAGVWHSRTFATALGVFGMVILWPRDFVLVLSVSLLSLIHPVAVLAIFPLVIVGPLVSLGVLMFIFSAGRLRSAWALKQYATLENTFPNFMHDLSSGGKADV